MRFIIYGAGAIGGAIGARLQLAGFEVILIARGAHADRLTTKGLHYTSPKERLILPVTCVTSPSAIDFQPNDIVLLTVKSQDTWQALNDLALVAPNSLSIFCAQNGVSNEALAHRFFQNVYAMLVLCPATHLSPGEIIHSAAAPGGLFDTGLYPSGSDAITEAVSDAMTRAGFMSQPDDQVMRLKYAKLLSNLGNPLELILAEGESNVQIMRALKKEALACYQAGGIICTPPEAMRQRFGLVNQVNIPNAPRGGSSTWQSVARGHSDIETPFLNGEICRLGRSLGIETPVNAAVLQLSLKASKTPKAFTKMSEAALLDQSMSARAGS
ncbi:MAG: ketopantoate reductase family protein [Pseudomonadales bacterium]